MSASPPVRSSSLCNDVECVKIRLIITITYDPGGGGGGKEKLGGVCGSLPITLTLFMTNICSFHYPIYDLTKIQYPIYDHCGWHSCPKHNLGRAFVNGLIDNDEKVASSKNIPRLECENQTLFMTKMD